MKILVVLLFLSVCFGKELEIASQVSICSMQADAHDSIPLRNTNYKLVIDQNIPGCTDFFVMKDYYPFLVEFLEEASSKLFTELPSHTKHASEWYHIAESRKYGLAIVHFDDLMVLESHLIHKQLLTRVEKKEMKKRLSFSEIETNVDIRSKQSVVDDLSGSLYYNVMEKLTGVKSFVVDGRTYTTKTRYTFSQESVYSASYILDWFKTYGCDESYYQEFPYSGSTSRNIICVKYGTTLKDEIVVFGGHMDSISERSSTDAPGCIDNGSGTDAVLQAVKAFQNTTTLRTVHFIAFGAEEQGLIGSTYYVNNIGSNGFNVVSGLTMDMIGYSNRYFGVTIEGTTDRAISELMDLVETNMKQFASSLTINKAYFSYGSDHIPFQRAGIPCILAIEQDDTNYPGYHRTSDQISYLNTDLAIQISRGMVGTLWDLTMYK